MSTTHLDPLHEAVSRLDAVWSDASDAAGLDRAGLVQANAVLGVLHRLVDGLEAEVAARIAHESRPELGAGSLAKEQGFRNAGQFVATVTGRSSGEASRLVKVGEATAPRSDLLGARLPAKYPAVQAALGSGRIGAPAAGLIIALLDRVRFKIDMDRLAEAEALLADKAAGLSLDEVRKLLTHTEAHLNPDGVLPREEAARAQNQLLMHERDGRFHLTADIDVATAAPIKTAVEGYVTAVFAARKNALDPDAVDADHRTIPQLQADALADLAAHVIGCDNNTPALAGATVIVRVSLDDLTGAGNGSSGTSTGTGHDSIDTSRPSGNAGAGRTTTGTGTKTAVDEGTDSSTDTSRTSNGNGTGNGNGVDSRTGTGTSRTGTGTSRTGTGTSRTGTGTSRTGTGYATIDGIDQPISIGAARRMAASGGVIPYVLGTDSEILDWGREKRFFTRTQRLALVERDGGCAMCTLPPSMTRAHHIDWWNRDRGRTDLSRGVLLCDNCHHRVHDNGWEIRIQGTGTTAKVWFIPPANIDPNRTPRLGGTARYNLAA